MNTTNKLMTMNDELTNYGCGRKLKSDQFFDFCGERTEDTRDIVLCQECSGPLELENPSRPNIFTSNTEVIGKAPSYTDEEIKNEPMLFSADWEFAYKNGGPITRNFLNHFLFRSNDWIIDTRVHMLMKDWYPCIGGWHCDNIPRNTWNGQPDYKNPAFISDHVLCVIDSGTGSLTEFVEDEIRLSDVPEDKMVYEHFSKEINSQVKDSIIKTTQFESGDVLSFNALTFHRGRPATGSGWRFFIRATTNTPQKAYNEVRRQVNVYLNTEKGW